MTLQRKLLLGFALMVVPTLFVGVQAIRTNALERATLETLGARLARSRTYADVYQQTISARPGTNGT